MKKWLIDTFLPMWAKQTILTDNKQLARQLRELKQENQCLNAYIRGLETGLRAGKKITIHTGGKP